VRTPEPEQDVSSLLVADNKTSQLNDDDETKSWDKIDTLVAEAQAML
jgi:hypothetical protein